MIMYADDTTLYCNINNTDETVITIHTELNKISCWLRSNKLSLNVGKTKYMVFHTTRKAVIFPTLYMNNIEIERT